MKFNPVFCRGLQLSILLVALSYCTQQKNVKGGDPDEVTADTSAVLYEYQNVKTSQNDSIFFVREHMRVFTDRINEIDRRLSQISIDFSAERRNMPLALGGEIFQLNKKHLELKARIRESVNYSSTAWIEFETKITEELAILEAAISDFEKK